MSMDSIQEIFQGKVPIPTKLVSFGFTQTKEGFEGVFPILDGAFLVRIVIGKEGVRTETTDAETGEPYSLHLVASAQGVFVGSVREAFTDLVEGIANRCFENAALAEDVPKRIFAYAKETFGTDPEFLWEKLPDCAVLRRSDTGKWYGVFMPVKREKFGLAGKSTVNVLDLRTGRDGLPHPDGKTIFPGYHMNKTHWFTVLLDGSVPAETIFPWIFESYTLATK